LKQMSQKMNADDRMRVKRKGMEVAYVAGQSQVAVVDRYTREVLVIIPDNMGDLSQMMVFSHEVGKSYLIRDTAVLVTDTKTEREIKTIAFGVEEQLNGILLVPSVMQLYVAVENGNVVVVDTITDEVKTTIPVGQYPCSMTATLDGARVYVRNYISQTLSVVDTKTNQVVDTIPVGQSDPFENEVHELDDMEYSCSKPSRKIMFTAPERKAEELSLLDERKVAKRKIGIREITVWIVVVISVVIASVVACMLLLDLCQLTRLNCPSKKCNVSIAYVVSRDSGGMGTVSVIDTDASRVLSTITVGSISISDFGTIAITPNGARAYVLGRDFSHTPIGSGLVYVIDSIAAFENRADSVQALIPVFGSLGAVTVSPDGAWVYVTGVYFDNGNGNVTISVIDTFTNEIASTIKLNVSDRHFPSGIVITPNGTRAYVTYISELGLISVVDIVNGTKKLVEETIPVGNYSAGIAITPSGTQVYVTNLNCMPPFSGTNGTISLIDTATNQVKMTISDRSGLSPYGIAVSPNREQAYVVECYFSDTSQSSSLTVINTVNNSVLQRIPVGLLPSTPVVSVDGTQIYVLDWDHIFNIIDSTTNMVMHKVPVGSNPCAIAAASVSVPC
jgi:YVTN family beta-propeller protein